MTFEILKKLIEKYNIPEDVKLMSDSGWECDPTDMDGVYYDAAENCIIFTEYISPYADYLEYGHHRYETEGDYKPIYGRFLNETDPEMIDPEVLKTITRVGEI